MPPSDRDFPGVAVEALGDFGAEPLGLSWRFGIGKLGGQGSELLGGGRDGDLEPERFGRTVGGAQGDGSIAGIEDAVDGGSAGVELPSQGGNRQATTSHGGFESGNESFFGKSLIHWPTVYQNRCSVKVSLP
jgi:hypothetical protein